MALSKVPEHVHTAPPSEARGHISGSERLSGIRWKVAVREGTGSSRRAHVVQVRKHVDDVQGFLEGSQRIDRAFRSPVGARGATGGSRAVRLGASSVGRRRVLRRPCLTIFERGSRWGCPQGRPQSLQQRVGPPFLFQAVWKKTQPEESPIATSRCFRLIRITSMATAMGLDVRPHRAQSVRRMLRAGVLSMTVFSIAVACSSSSTTTEGSGPCSDRRLRAVRMPFRNGRSSSTCRRGHTSTLEQGRQAMAMTLG